MSGAGDVIARAISDSMNVPELERIRAQVSEEEYHAILLLAGYVVQSTAFAGLNARLVLLALEAAAAMYREGLNVSAALLGRGPGSN